MMSLREKYLLLNELKNIRKEYKAHDKNNIDKLIKKYTKEIRNELERNNDRYYGDIVKADFEQTIHKMFIEGNYTMEEINEWFMDYQYIKYRNSPYDCTGQLFTGWYRIFKCNGKFVIYHCISVDC